MAKPSKVIILGDSKDAERAFKQIRDEAGKTQSKLAKVGEKMGSVGRGMTKGLTLPILGAGVALFKLGQKAGENADRLLDMSAQTGISTDALQEYEFVAGQAGVATDFFKKAAEAVIKDLDKVAEGVGPAADAYAELGVSVLDANGELRSAGDITEDAMDALAAIEDPTKRAALAQDIFKGANQDMLAVLSQGTDVINEQRRAAQELGAVQSNEALQGANKFRMGMENLKSQIGGIVGTLGAEFAPLLSDVVLPLIQDHVVPAIRAFAEFVGNLSDRFNALSPRMKGLIGGLIGAAAVAGPVLVVGGKLVKTFGVVGKAFGVLSKILMANPWVLLIAAVIALVVIIVKNWDKITAFLSKVWDGIKTAVSAVGEWISNAFGKAVAFVKNLFLNFTPLGILISKFDKIKEIATTAATWIKDKFTGVIDFFREMPGKIGSAVAGMWDGIKTAFKAAVNWIIDKWNSFELKIGGQTISLGPLGKITIPSVTLNTPHIPRLHTGGVFRAPTRGGEGLAVLKDRERVTPAGAHTGPPMIIQLVVDGRILAESLIRYEEALA